MIRTALRTSQREAVTKALGHDGFALFPEQRVGKCLVALAIFDARPTKELLIVCPKIAMPVWKREIEKHLDRPGVEIYIENFEQLINDKKNWYRWADSADFTMIVDESHRIKKRGSKWSKTCRTMSKRARYRLALTGTPIAQGLHDAWAQFDFIDPTIFGPYEQFEERYLIVKMITTATKSWEKIVGYKNIEEFQKIFHQYSYRITLNESRKMDGKKAIVTRRIPVVFDLEPSARLRYEEVSVALDDEIENPVIDLSGVLEQNIRLQQLTGGFLLGERVSWEKQRQLVKLVATLRQRVVVVCRFIAEIESIALALNGAGLSVTQIRGGHPFDGDFKTEVVIIQIQSGVAIDLSNASVIIFYSWDYSYINHEQIRFRIRAYHLNRITEYYLIGKDTVDEEIHQSVIKKKDLVSLVCDKYRRNRDGKRVERSHQSSQTDSFHQPGE